MHFLDMTELSSSVQVHSLVVAVEDAVISALIL